MTKLCPHFCAIYFSFAIDKSYNFCSLFLPIQRVFFYKKRRRILAKRLPFINMQF